MTQAIGNAARAIFLSVLWLWVWTTQIILELADLKDAAFDVRKAELSLQCKAQYRWIIACRCARNSYKGWLYRESEVRL